MKSKLEITVFLVLLNYIAYAQMENVVIVTTDGLRWQELFSGVDTSLANNKQFNEGDRNYIYKKYGDTDPHKSREKLFPFFWQSLIKQGSIYGNRNDGNKVNVTNPYWFSYPGYSEIFTGYADVAINSNEYKPNPNTTILEFLNTQPKFKSKIAAFGAWDAFDRILNQQRSGIPVYSAFDTVGGKQTVQQKLINQMLRDSYRPWGNAECLDVFTHYAALEYLKVNKPKVLFIGYGETDEWAHHGMYRSYLDAAHMFDQWVAQIWSYIQSEPAYKNKTALFITTDHGRGDLVKSQWTSHGSEIKDSDETWMMLLVPGTAAKGEVKINQQLYANQIAQTIANALGVTYKAAHTIGKKIDLK